MKVSVGIFLHELLVVWEQIKVRLCYPLIERLVELPRIPSSKWNVLEQRRFEKIKFWLADHLRKHSTFDNCTLQFKVDENNVFFKRQLHLKMEIYCQEAATNGMLNCNLTEMKIVQGWLKTHQHSGFHYLPANLRSLLRSCFRHRSHILRSVHDWTSSRCHASL